MEKTTLKHSTELENTTLTLPGVPEDFLILQYLAGDDPDSMTVCQQLAVPYPLAAGDLIALPIKDVIQLSKGDSVKEAIEISFDTSDKDFQFMPGDTIGIIPANLPSEVQSILTYLGLSESSKRPFKIQVKEKITKKNASKPLFIPEITNALHILEKCLEIRAPLKKLFVRALVEYTAESKEKRRLEELCSRQGAKEFARFITEAKTTLLDILECFPSCRPPITRLVEFLPRLSARPYSISSSPLIGHEFHITLSLETFIRTSSTDKRHGVCSGWLFQLATKFLNEKCEKVKDPSLNLQLENLSLKEKKEGKQVQLVQLFLRKSTDFCLPKDQSLPLILIGPGTGVAPFVGFLQHRDLQKKKQPDLEYGDIWLFFGCRCEKRDYIYKDVISSFIENGVLSKLFVSFSRDSQKVKYVQDNIALNSKQFVEQMLTKKSMVFVCGDASGMAKDVLQSIVSAFQIENGITEQEAAQQVNDLRNKGRYLQDIWV